MIQLYPRAPVGTLKLQHEERLSEQWLRAVEESGNKSQGWGLGRSRVLVRAATRDNVAASWDPLLEVVSFGSKGKATAKAMLLESIEGRMDHLLPQAAARTVTIFVLLSLYPTPVSLLSLQCSFCSSSCWNKLEDLKTKHVSPWFPLEGGN